MCRGIVRVLAAVLACSTSLSCATVIHQTRQDVGIASIPSGASVAIDNRPTGKTPLVADLKRKENHFIKIEMLGYETYETTVTHKVSGWVWGNVVFGGLIGLAIDALSGGMYKLTPDQITAELRKQGQASFMKRDGLYLAVVLTPEPDWEKVGQLKRTARRIE
ncbi:MAG: PEGA domain-containing protein [Candidatus Omnitrophica bacterium]|nr:PEGA domain-containing protein [Candidatus Omnitrophota bacterium]